MRLAVAGIVLALVYAAIVAGYAGLYVWLPAWWPYWIAAGLALGFALVLQYRSAEQLLLRAVDAKFAPADDWLRNAVERLAALADVPAPRVALAETSAANAFAIGLSHRRSIVVVTDGLLHALEPHEVEAVIAHEIAHLAHHDAAVMTAVAMPKTLGLVMVADESALQIVWLVLWPLGLVPFAIGWALTLFVSRAREFAADRTAALMVGRPAELMSALVKLSERSIAIPQDDLRGVNAFCIVPSAPHRSSLFSDHPPLAKRLHALEELTRKLGEAATPRV